MNKFSASAKKPGTFSYKRSKATVGVTRRVVR